MNPLRLMSLVALAAAIPACNGKPSSSPDNSAAPVGQAAAAHAGLEELAAAFVPLTLEAGTHEAEYVDAYYGPADLKAKAEAKPRSRADLETAARAAVVRLDREVIPGLTAPDDLVRARALRGFYQAAATRLAMIGGQRFSFDEEAQGLFGVKPQLKPLSHYDAILAGLNDLIPGKGALPARVDAFNERYVIPKHRLQSVFDAAIAECRKRTMAHFTLPKEESFKLEFVTGKPWSGYNYYKGNYHSLIQVNTDLPIRISRAVDLGCHEGYPGHHVLNLMIESKLARGKGWREYEVNPLYSPQSLISEGSANFGIDLAFPGPERLAFERDVLYPLAGLDPKTAETYWKVQQATEALTGARLTIARMYLDGEIDRAKAVELSQKYLLLSPQRAEQSVGFTDHYRSYVINYGLGKDMVQAYVDAAGSDAATRWKRMEHVLSDAVIPADLLKR